MIKLGVVGVGHIGRFHAINLKALHGKECELTGFYDINPARSAEITAELGIHAFSSYAELLAACDGVLVAVPTVSHYEIMHQALQQGKHVFCEKPFTETLEEARQIIDLAEAKKLTLQIGHIERFNPALKGFEKLDFKPLFIESHRISPFPFRGLDVAVIPQVMIHDIDLILTLVKSPIASMDASGTAVLSDTIDIANARLKFENGCVANITASRVSDKKMRKLRIFQKDQYVSIDFLENKSNVFALDRDTLPNPEQAGILAEMPSESGEPARIWHSQSPAPEQNAMLEEQRDFIRAITTGTQPLVTGEDGYRALDVSLKIEAMIYAGLKKLDL